MFKHARGGRPTIVPDKKCGLASEWRKSAGIPSDIENTVRGADGAFSGESDRENTSVFDAELLDTHEARFIISDGI